MTPQEAAAVRDFAREIRTLPGRGDSPAERCESAGRLFWAALETGAFQGPDYAGFRVLVQQRREQHGRPTLTEPIDGWLSAWHEAVWWLRDKPKGPRPDDEATFRADCEFVAELLEQEAGPTKGKPKVRGPKGPRSDTKQDKQNWEGWKASGYTKMADYAANVLGMADAKQLRELRLSINRHDKRLRRKGLK